MKNFFLFLTLLVATVSIFLLVRFNQENAEKTQSLEQERFSRMTAEEDLQKDEYRIKKLEADLQTAQVKSSKTQEALDREKEVTAELKSQLEQLGKSKDSLERELGDALKNKLP